VDLVPAVSIAPPEAAAWATLIGADRLRESGGIALDRFIDDQFPGIEVRKELAEGDPATIIVEFAEQIQAGLIMIPTGGAGAFRRFLLGSVTAKVLHDTSVPVWTGVHAEEIAAHRPDRWARLLCAVEDDQRDLPVLEWAAEFACKQNLQLRLAHAVHGPEDCEENPAFREFLYNAGRDLVDGLQRKAGKKFDACIQIGAPGPVIRNAAAGFSADLLVIGRGVIQKRLGRLRSGAYEIIREAPCPVISV
jgi:nucleotide-binding universal stress UspA family protein